MALLVKCTRLPLWALSSRKHLTVLFSLSFFQASCTSSSIISQHSTRGFSSVHTQQPAGPIREYKIDPYILLEDELKYVFEDIRQVRTLKNPKIFLIDTSNVGFHETKWFRKAFYAHLIYVNDFCVTLETKKISRNSVDLNVCIQKEPLCVFETVT